jgi:hypothetical protein
LMLVAEPAQAVRPFVFRSFLSIFHPEFIIR